MRTQKHKYLPYFMWLFPLLFFAYQFIPRLWPGLMMQQIMEQFSIDATHFGVLAAFYYYGYAGMQIPVAMLLERFSVRYVLFTFAIICGLATLVFTYTDNFYVALFSRFLVGAGSGVGFLSVSKVISEWFPKEQYAKMVGFSFTFGLMGAVYGGKPVSMLIEMYSWQNVALVLAGTSILIGCCAYLALYRGENAQSTKEEEVFKMANLREVLSSPVIWLLAFANLLMVGSLEGFADVWGVQYLMAAYTISKGDAAMCVSFVYFGMLVGGPLLALCSKRFGNYPVIAACGLGMALLAFVLFSFSSTYNVELLCCLFFAIGIMCCYQVIVFAACSGLVATKSLGITIAFLNCINMLGGSFFHTVIGKVMDVLWSGALTSDGIRQYDLEVYKYALTIIPVCAVVGAAIVGLVGLMVRRKHSLLVFENAVVS